MIYHRLVWECDYNGCEATCTTTKVVTYVGMQLRHIHIPLGWVSVTDSQGEKIYCPDHAFKLYQPQQW